MVVDSYHHGDLRQALLDAAAAVLEAEGVDAVSLRGLARRLDVSHAAPGHHFQNRLGLLAELAADGFVQLAADMDHAMEHGDPSDLLVAAGRAYVRYAVANPERYRLMFGSQLMTSDGCPERLAVEAGSAFAGLQRAVGAEVPAARPESIGQAELGAWSLVHGAVMLWLDGQLLTLDADAFVELAERVLTDFASASSTVEAR